MNFINVNVKIMLKGGNARRNMDENNSRNKPFSVRFASAGLAKATDAAAFAISLLGPSSIDDASTAAAAEATAMVGKISDGIDPDGIGADEAASEPRGVRGPLAPVAFKSDAATACDP